MLKVRRAAVLGAGVMGAQIAAYLAAAGVRTYLLDMTTSEPPQDPQIKKMVGKNYRSLAALRAIDNLKKLKPSPLVSDSVLANLIPGNFDDDMAVLADVDWVIEAVVENLDIKKKMMRLIATHAPQHIPITTNTSGLSMAKMCESEDEFFQKRFFGTHFFNPPRYMKLVEIVPHAKSDPAMMKDVANWIEERLGKGIVYTKDTVNFIANRIGVFNLQATLKHADDLKLNVETVDALTGKLMGRPASASFRTLDVVGIDTFVKVAKNVYDYDSEDPYRDWFQAPRLAKQLVEKKALGQKTNDTGAYKKVKEDGQTKILAYRPEKDTYEEQNPQDFPWVEAAMKEKSVFKRLAKIFEEKDAGAELVKRSLMDTFAYSALLVHEIADDHVQALDDAIRWGFNWDWGPFQLWQGMGYDFVLEKMKDAGVKLPDWCKPGLEFYKPGPASATWHMTGPTEVYVPSRKKFDAIARKPYQFFLPKMENKEDKRVVLSNASASLVDVGHGVACLTFHTKMNALNGAIIEMTFKALEKVQKDFGGLVVSNDADAFSAGADLKEILASIQTGNFSAIETVLKNFQGAMQLMKYASFPSVATPHGMTLGGGCEFSLQTSRQLLAGETYAGLVEAGVGLIPAGGGLKELALRAYEIMKTADGGDAMPFLMRAFMLVGLGRVSASGQEAIEMGLYPATASVSLSRDHLVDRAKGMVLEMLNRGYTPATPTSEIKVLGDPGVQTFNMMLYNMREARRASAHDMLVAEKVAIVLCGGEIDPGETVSEGYLLELEREGFLALCREPKTRERIEHMLQTGKPLRN